MTGDEVNAFCAALPDATHSDPWGGGGHDVWKVADKIFASIGAGADGVAVKIANLHDAALLIDLGRAAKAPYFHRSWVLVPFGVLILPGEMRSRIETSYTTIRNGLPRKVDATLTPFHHDP